MKADKSIRQSVSAIFLLLAIGPLFLLAAILTWHNFQVQQQQAIDFQKEYVKTVAHDIYQPIAELQHDLITAKNCYNVSTLNVSEQLMALSLLHAQHNKKYRSIMTELTLLNSEGMELNKVSTHKIYLPSDMRSRAGDEVFLQVKRHKKVFFSAIWFDQETGEPLQIMGVPWVNIRSNQLEAVLVVELRLKELWRDVITEGIGKMGSVYIIDSEGRVVAHENPSVVLSGTRYKPAIEAGLQQNSEGDYVSLAASKIRLGNQSLQVITELPFTEAFGLTIQNLVVIVLIMLLAVLVSLVGTFIMIKRTVMPIESLAATAVAIAKGDLSQRAEVISNDEIGLLGKAFNRMTDRLVETINHLEESVFQVDQLAHFDPLTGLANRRLLEMTLKKSLSESRRQGMFGALIFFDLDHFKKINDSLGHSMGDSLLQQVSERILSEIRVEDTASRLGGDEFVVLLKDLSRNVSEATQNARQVAEKLRVALAEPYYLGHKEYRITSSIGVVMYPNKSQTVDDFLKHADTAMYRSKDMGRNKIHFYQPEMQDAVNQRLKMERALQQAVVNEVFILHYQPDVNSQGKVIGVECLVRWPSASDEMKSPEVFIPIAEETGLIVPLGDWILNRACRQYMDWMKDDLALVQYIGVNVSYNQFHQPDFVDKVIHVLGQTGMPAHALKLELTESLLMADVESSIHKMQLLKDLGVQFSIDDFGTGYSSLSYLTKLPLDILKIDKSFVQNVSEQSCDSTIVETIIAMAKKLDLKVVAEGIESSQQLAFLDQLGCDSYQGYLFSKPLDPNALATFVKQFQSTNLLQDKLT